MAPALPVPGQRVWTLWGEPFRHAQEVADLIQALRQEQASLHQSHVEFRQACIIDHHNPHRAHPTVPPQENAKLHDQRSCSGMIEQAQGACVVS